MVFVLALLLALLALWAYVRWEARQFKSAPVAPIERSRMERGYKPEGTAKWQIYLGVGAMAALLAFSEWQAPSRAPFTGRWSALKSLVIEALGGSGLLVIYVAVSSAFLVAAVVSFRGGRR